MNNFFSKKNTLGLIYSILLIFFSTYYFISGYNNYLKIANTNIDINKESQLNSEDYKENKIFNIPGRIAELQKKYQWNRTGTENKIKLENTKVAFLLNKMTGKNYDLEKVSFTKEVPGFFVSKLPSDISYIKDTKVKKKVFISIVLPLIVQSNRDILLKRKRLENIYIKLKSSETLSLNEHRWLFNLASNYSINIFKNQKIKIAERLLEHIDIIPNSIAIAQAAKESGWGTSRFAKEGNALFGQWTYNDKNGLLPSNRLEGEIHLIKSFNTIGDSVRSYMNNINTHNAYKGFREIRAGYRKSNLDLDPYVLVNELSPYAELKNYTEILKVIMESNKLFLFDNIILVDEESLV